MSWRSKSSSTEVAMLQEESAAHRSTNDDQPPTSTPAHLVTATRLLARYHVKPARVGAGCSISCAKPAAITNLF